MRISDKLTFKSLEVLSLCARERFSLLLKVGDCLAAGVGVLETAAGGVFMGGVFGRCPCSIPPLVVARAGDSIKGSSVSCNGRLCSASLDAGSVMVAK